MGIMWMDAWREILGAVSGLTPQLITETLYYLTQKRDPTVAIAEIHVLTTQPGGQRILTDLLTPDGGHFHALCGEYNLDPTTIAFDAEHIHVFTDVAGIPIDDIRTAADSAAVADQILAVIRRLTDDPTTRLHCSLAGGRKTQSALLGFALQLYGRPQDTLLHVLVDEAFENHTAFFYPPRQPRLIQTADGRQLDARTARVTVAEIPYVRLRDKLSTSLTHPTSGFAPTIDRLQHTLDTLPNVPPLVIDPAARKVCIGVTQIALEPVEIVLYTQLALAKIQQVGRGDGFLSLKELNGKRQEMLLRYERLYGAYSGHVENLRQAWEKSIRPARLRSHFSKITRKIRQVVPGNIEVSFYEVTSNRRYGATRYGLRLLPERIEVHEA
jgi:CRISPR-associated protein (TIGR02584 family)